jgi:anti-sigma factor RsiW
MNCFEYQNRFQSYLDGALDEIESRELEAHVAFCASCQAELREIEHVFETLDHMPVLTLDRAFEEEVLAAVDVRQYRARPADVLREVLAIPGRVMPAPARLAVSTLALTTMVGLVFTLAFYGGRIAASAGSFFTVVGNKAEASAAFLASCLSRLGEVAGLFEPLFEQIAVALHLGHQEVNGDLALVALVLFTLSSMALMRFIRRSQRPAYHHARSF